MRSLPKNQTTMITDPFHVFSIIWDWSIYQ